MQMIYFDCCLSSWTLKSWIISRSEGRQKLATFLPSIRSSSNIFNVSEKITTEQQQRKKSKRTVLAVQKCIDFQVRVFFCFFTCIWMAALMRIFALVVVSRIRIHDNTISRLKLWWCWIGRSNKKVKGLPWRAKDISERFIQIFCTCFGQQA